MGYLREYFRLLEDVNKVEYWVLEEINLEMAQCAEGCFEIGCDYSEYKFAKTPEEMKSHESFCFFPYNEKKHSVYVDDYKIGKYPVTQEQYEAVMGKNPSRFKGKSLPVENVTYDDALEFCRRLNSKFRNSIPTGYKFDLPTEAQWENACRANEKTSFNNGKNIPLNQELCFGENSDLNLIAWNCYNSGDRTHEVGKKKPNYWGIYDMHGNVSEWCKDWYGNYDDEMYKCDSDGIINNPTGPNKGMYRVIRGGAYNDSPAKCRSSYRDSAYPTAAADYIGFRVALVRAS